MCESSLNLFVLTGLRSTDLLSKSISLISPDSEDISTKTLVPDSPLNLEAVFARPNSSDEIPSTFSIMSPLTMPASSAGEPPRVETTLTLLLSFSSPN